MPKIIIDDREIEVAPGTKVIEAAEKLGIMIPRFCYHPALGSVGACRVCAVKFLQGPFKGVTFSDGKIEDPNGQIAACWKGVGNNTVKLKDFLDRQNKKIRARVLVEISRSAQEEVASELWEMFKKLVPLCMGRNTLGLVAGTTGTSATWARGQTSPRWQQAGITPWG